jgi:hypothetical protein
MIEIKLRLFVYSLFLEENLSEMEKQGFEIFDFEEDYMIKKRCTRREFNTLDAKEKVACYELRPHIPESFGGILTFLLFYLIFFLMLYFNWC